MTSSIIYSNVPTPVHQPRGNDMRLDKDTDLGIGAGHNYSPIRLRQSVMARAVSMEQSRRLQELEAQVRIQTAIGVLQGITLLLIIYASI